MEEEVRRQAGLKGDLSVYAGGLGVLELEGRPIYLGRRRREPVLPVPKLLFKLVHSPKHNQALVYLAANNPYLGDEQLGEYVVCKEYVRCRQLEPRYHNKDKGFLYCCLYRDFIESPAGKELGLPVIFPQNVTALL